MGFKGLLYPTAFDADLIEALAYQDKNTVRAVSNHTDYLERRKVMM